MSPIRLHVLLARLTDDDWDVCITRSDHTDAPKVPRSQFCLTTVKCRDPE